MNDTMAVCGITYFIAKVQDAQIRTVLEYALQLSKKQVERVKLIFTEEQYPVPQGFTEQDVDVNAPRLFSDNFFLIYIANMGRYGLAACSLALSSSSRADIRSFFSEYLASATELFNKAIEVLLEKGIYLRPPYIPAPKQIEYVHDQHFLGNFLNLGKERPLLALEIANLTYNINRNMLGKALIMGFSQVAKLKEIRQYFERGRDISQKHVEIFSARLNKEHLPTPMSWDSEVTDSTTPPFSDKLMMFHIAALVASSVGQYGISMSTSPRADLATMYTRLSVEIGNYAIDGAKIFIENGWMEKPPQSADHEALAKV
jgi:hypothetical protein